MELHIGQEIEAKYKESGIKLSEFAKRLDTSTRNIYSIFGRPDINSAQLKKISEVLSYDFFKLYQDTIESNIVNEPEGKFFAKRKKISVTVELDGQSTTLESWCETLKKINAVL